MFRVQNGTPIPEAFPFFIGFPKGIHDQSGIRLVRGLPRDNLAGGQVDDDAEIVPFSARFDIGKITGPD